MVVRVACTGVTGTWKPSDAMVGFSVYTADGVASAQTTVTNAWCDPANGSDIRILLNRPPDPDELLAYGCGSAPVPCAP